MLIEKSINANDIVTLKLISGEEIIARVVELDSNTVTITKPLVMNLSMDESGRPAIQMLPFFLLGSNQDSKLQLQRSHIIILTLSNEGAKSGYIHNTSGLITGSQAQKSIIG
jgi:hypothetical protein